MLLNKVGSMSAGQVSFFGTSLPECYSIVLSSIILSHPIPIFCRWKFLSCSHSVPNKHREVYIDYKLFDLWSSLLLASCYGLNPNIILVYVYLHGLVPFMSAAFSSWFFCVWLMAADWTFPLPRILLVWLFHLYFLPDYWLISILLNQ